MGIHTGNIVARDIGTDKVVKYGAIGEMVNIAARLEQANKSIGSCIFSLSICCSHREHRQKMQGGKLLVFERTEWKRDNLKCK